VLNLALNVHFQNCFLRNRFTQKKYFDESIFCANRLTTKNIFHWFTFLLNRIGSKKYFHSLSFLSYRFTTKIIFHLVNFLSNQFVTKKYFRCKLFFTHRFSKTFSNRSSKKVAYQLSDKIKNWAVSFLYPSVVANIYKLITQFFVQHVQPQKIYFDHLVFLPSEHVVKHKNDSEKKYKNNVPLNDLNACF